MAYLLVNYDAKSTDGATNIKLAVMRKLGKGGENDSVDAKFGVMDIHTFLNMIKHI